jgi:hypothetical protein
MVSLFTVLCSCCSRPRLGGRDNEPDETSRLIPVLIDPSPNSTSPQPDHIDQQVVQERLGNIVRNTRGKMVNVTAPSNVQHQIWRNAVDAGVATQPAHVNDSRGQTEAEGNTEGEENESQANKVRLFSVFSTIYRLKFSNFKSKSRGSSPSRNPTQAPPIDAFQLQGTDALSVSW